MHMGLQCLQWPQKFIGGYLRAIGMEMDQMPNQGDQNAHTGLKTGLPSDGLGKAWERHRTGFRDFYEFRKKTHAII